MAVKTVVNGQTGKHSARLSIFEENFLGLGKTGFLEKESSHCICSSLSSYTAKKKKKKKASDLDERIIQVDNLN